KRRLGTGIRERSVLCEHSRLIGEQVGTAAVLHMILSEPSVHFYRRRTQHVIHRRCDIYGVLTLPLILSGRLLVVRVRRLKARLRANRVPLQTRLRGGMRVEAVKQVEHWPVVVERLQLGCVEKPLTRRTIDRQEVADAVIAMTDTQRRGARAKRAEAERCRSA